MERPSVLLRHVLAPVIMAIVVNGAAVHLQGRPDPVRKAPPLLLLHGAGMSHAVWDAVRAPLAEAGIAAVAPDLPGHGCSGGAPIETIEEMADWTCALAQALGWRRLVLAGHSMGGLVALEAGARQSGLFSGLALIGTGLAMPVNPELIEAAAADLPRAAGLIARWSFGRGTEDEEHAQAARRLVAASVPGVLATDLRACDAYRGGAAAARRIACPALILTGSADRMVLAARSRQLAAAITGARAIELPGSGHVPLLDAPDRVAEALRDLTDAQKAGRWNRPAV